MREKVFHFFGLSFLFLYPFFKFVLHQGYPLGRFEILIYAVVWFCLVLLLVIGTGRPFPIALFVFFLFLLFFTTAPKTIPPGGLWTRGVMSLALAGLFWKFPRRMFRLLAIFVAGVLITDLGLYLSSHNDITPPRPSGASPQALTVIPSDPPHHILYLILDEHIGLAGMPSQVPETDAAKKQIASFYEKYRFTLFGRAYSPYFYSDNSISNVLNRTTLTDKDAYFSRDEDDVRILKENRFFERMAALGYRINVYWPDYIDFCATSPVDVCYRYSKNSILSIGDAPLNRLEKTWVVGSLFLATNSLFREIDKRVRDRNIFKIKTGPITVVPDLLKRVGEDMRTAEHNTLFFAHVLMPHFPYVYDARCGMRPVKDWRNRNEFNDEHKKNSPTGYRERYRLYYEQMECLNRWLAGLFDELKEAGLYDQATIVVHGDHGSRINLEHDPYYDYHASLSEKDLVTSFSTLLAVKQPGQAVGGISGEMGDVGGILSAVLDEGGEYHEKGPHLVYLKQKKGKRELMSYPMPAL